MSDNPATRRTFLKLAGAAALTGLTPADAQVKHTQGRLEQSYLDCLYAPVAFFRPTERGCTMHWIARNPTEVEIHIGHKATKLHRVHQTISSGPDQYVLEKFAPDKRYFVQFRYRPAGQATWRKRRPRALRTTRAAGSTFRVGLIADSHFYRATRKKDDVINFIHTLRAVREEKPDFVIFLGDEATVHYLPVGDDPVYSQDWAIERWREWRQAAIELLGSTPAFLVLGNHEGESGYYQHFGHNGQMAYLQRWGTIARKQHFLNPLPSTYPESGENERWSGDPASPALGGADLGNCSPLQNYYAWTWGDALFVVLDVQRYTNPGGRPPARVEEWTLGPAQMRWFEQVLAGSAARWKIVVGHHLVGGYAYNLPGDTKKTDYVYGRGGAHYANVGEQARITRLMNEHGAQFFLYGHDHVFAHQQAENVNFVCCGRPTFLQDEWWRTPGWHEAYGDPDIRTPNDFYAAIGYTRLTVSPEGVDLAYIRSGNDRQGRENVSVRSGQVYCDFVSA